MSKTFKAMWLGDDDPQAQIIRLGDLRFIKGEATDVPEDHEYADRIKDNPMFAIDDAKAEATPAREPDDVDPDAGTEKGALRTELKKLGVTVSGNASVETLRQKLVEATR